MRRLLLSILSAAALCASVGMTQATPLSASSALASPGAIEQALPDAGVSLAHWHGGRHWHGHRHGHYRPHYRHHWRHYGWHHRPHCWWNGYRRVCRSW
jgi:hypothetical protein